MPDIFTRIAEEIKKDPDNLGFFLQNVSEVDAQQLQDFFKKYGLGERGIGSAAINYNETSHYSNLVLGAEKEKFKDALNNELKERAKHPAVQAHTLPESPVQKPGTDTQPSQTSQQTDPNPDAIKNVLTNITFGKIGSQQEDAAFIKYSQDRKSLSISDRLDAQQLEERGIKYILKLYEVPVNGFVSGGGVDKQKGDYALTLSTPLTYAQQTELKQKFDKLTNKEAQELFREGVQESSRYDAAGRMEDNYSAAYHTSAAKKFIAASIELTKIDLPERDGASTTTQKELDQLVKDAKAAGALLTVNNVQGDKDSITAKYEDGSQVTYNVKFSNDSVKAR